MAIASLLIIGVSLLTSDFLRRRLKALFPASFGRSLVVDFLLTFELCTAAFELGVILDQYGFGVWAVALYANCLYQCFRWREFEQPSPIDRLLDHLTGSKGLAEVLARTVVLVLSGLATYRYIKLIWQLELTSMHSGRPEAIAACSLPWTELPTYQLFLAEALGSLVLGIGPKLVLDNPTLANNDPLFTALLIAAQVVVAVGLAFDISGGMFNPMLASVLLGGCSGHSWMQHIAVYWVGAMTGSVLAYKVYPAVKETVYGADKNEAKKKA